MSEISGESIKQLARRAGFDLVGITSAEPLGQESFFRNWLAKGFQGDMQYLERNIETRCDPRRLVSGARSVICTALSYYTEPENLTGNPSCGRIARFAWGEDYHVVLKKQLRLLMDEIHALTGYAFRMRSFVDTAPVFEKLLAARAGLGWIGKNSLLIHPQFGSWLVLGEIVTDAVLPCDMPLPDGCGECTRCLENCPTGALVQPRCLDARRCISYLTQVTKKPIPAEFSDKMKGFIFGCDVCQDFCPYNQKPERPKDPRFNHNGLV
jgi:epoxyqueuosine reductase